MNKRISIDGVLVGGYTDDNAKSGLTVVVMDNRNNTVGLSQRGGSPATLGTDLLRPLHRRDQSVDAIVLTGRSVFGFRAVNGVLLGLYEMGKGFKIGDMRVPIVAAAAIYDFYDNHILPTEEWGLKALKNLSQQIMIGRYWAGRGATVGKLNGIRDAKPSGQGYYELEKGKVKVGVISVVNSIGNVYDEEGNLIAGNESDEMRLSTPGTTLGVVLTNAKLSNSDACRIASSAENGFSAIIRPYNLSLDGDTVFTISTNEVDVNVDDLIFLTYESSKKSVLSIFK
ncbi:peptidase [Sulfolobus sp. A20]|uniref:P1 family peptidase n=1 Tax=Sulfolobaceae TaxID=118883 RepID=UPI00084620C2|nr:MULTISPECIES: P1 family peptidase [unclassified Sulfolobus]TRM75544.1 peptidase S58 family protein [Sulfolobus sp. E5]TRM75605.1 peptidase S58 family protein [Sulfolobus sp. A20-N-F8]TRM78472.1 peptidase S58 family protein [Sulfolobus sp. B5]TRM85235.1 peptidase S58 family protein [Sulfolobus sp. F3]TRM86986.1 peptidase S58 family protein [Sulfolobus sp. C3]TRM99381.1 peptidase S58 family protein [Sulfolobus sp. F1]TRN04615.1 peptidase S58 family protein [Sulfolobus sp. E1]